MPRNDKDPKRLSEAWKYLNNTDKIPIVDKLKYSTKLIDKALTKAERPMVSWSGGKDSTVILHQILSFSPNIPVVFTDIDSLFPETVEYVYRLADLWKINLYITKPKEENFDSITKKYGYPIFSKNIASNVERAVRTGNIRKQLSEFEKFLVENKAKISTKCSQHLLEKPCKQKEKELQCDLKFIGLRALESRSRVRLWADYGDMYTVKNYYGKKKPIIKCSPISTWSDNDIWKYINLKSLPVCEIYRKGYERNGCWTCAMAIRNGQLKRLKVYNKKLYYHLIDDTEMGQEIKRLKNLLNNTHKFKNYIVL